MLSNKNLQQLVIQLFIRGKKLGAIISFIKKNLNKHELCQGLIQYF